METTEVVIAGGGPTGLMLAVELRLAEVDVVLLDGLPERTGESRAGGLHARTMEILDQRGLLDDLIARGRVMQAGHFGALPLDFSDFDTRHPHMLAVLQSVVERELDHQATELGAPVRWASPVAGFTQDANGIDVEVGGPDGTRRIRAKYLVGCDGGRSTVRKLAGIGFTGTDATMTGMLADVELAEPPAEPFFGRRRGAGDFSAVQFEPGWYRLVVQRHDLVMPRGATLTFEEFRDHFREIAGTDFGMHSPRWVTHYGDASRQAERYREGRVFLAGDAAHIHYPAGGQGQNLGVQDAVNLGWKLAIALRGNDFDEVLNTYESERLAVGARVLHNTRAQTAAQRPGAHAEALRDILGDLIDLDVVRHRLGLMITALDIRYDTKGDHPLAGRRVPDGDLSAAGGETRVYELLRSARPILLRLNGNRIPSVDGWQDRVDVVDALARDERWAVPGVGDIAVPAAVLIRPDGYVAWVSDEFGAEGLPEALGTWFGPAV
ncbi:3-(3-hydroxy-phenyl)propionate hydroxylase [Nocardia tenerifensis]|uniref:3-(3-hydroxy-phenyl)propionate hydroxylase n=1 Tax=Nocardia tenerifensis TaxID=228006 RepID=A0A318K1Q2_9NOCA|nr:FAD-dependent monooxygenase [Nocardia tenerifensis]PXX54593.1 3-(3-hydroxy-phenyl)propionate hydroxylase [Nocardia tenerifensis]